MEFTFQGELEGSVGEWLERQPSGTWAEGQEKKKKNSKQVKVSRRRIALDAVRFCGLVAVRWARNKQSK